jgi:hypothetical protein
MKTLQPFLAVLLLASATTHGALYSPSSGMLNTVIPDANPTGISSTLNVSGGLPTISDVNVTINVSGGFNGDLYAYLSHNGILVPLLNRVGTTTGVDPFGYSTAGFSSITLDDQATANGNIHGVLTPTSGASYQPDSGSGSLGNFNSYNPSGNWTIFFADMASGGGSGPSTLISWSLDITAVPEPVNMALGVFGGLGLVVATWRSRFWKSKSKIEVRGIGLLH